VCRTARNTGGVAIQKKWKNKDRDRPRDFRGLHKGPGRLLALEWWGRCKLVIRMERDLERKKKRKKEKERKSKKKI